MNRFFVDTNKMSVCDLKELRKLEYSRWKPLKCPLLDEDVSFNKYGFYHLTHDGRDRIRKESAQRMRLNLLPDVRKAIYRAREFGAEKRVIPADQNKFGKEIAYYELVYRFNNKKAVAVGLRRIGQVGKLHFYSVRYYNRGRRKH